MSEINWSLLGQPVDVGAQITQGFATGVALTNKLKAQHALSQFASNPDDPNAFNALAIYAPDTAQNILQSRALQQKQADAERLRTVSSSVGQIAATGDYKGAQRAALGAGQVDLAQEYAKLDEGQTKRVADNWAQAGSIAYRLKGLSSPQERVAYWAQARPILEQAGVTADVLDSVDPNNIGQLDAIITRAQDIKSLFEQSQPKVVATAPGGGAIAVYPGGRVEDLVLPNAGDHAYGAPAGSAPTSGGAGGNNFGTGLRKPGSKEFQQFGSQQEAHSAQEAQLGRYMSGAFDGKPKKTVKDIVSTYSPNADAGGDNTNEQTANYIGYVSKRLGVNPNDTLSPALLPKLAGAMREWESGHPAKGVIAANQALHGEDGIREAAKRAIAAGADPATVRARAAAHGVVL